MNREDQQAGHGQERILAEGRNCWRVARADRLAFLVDAAAYFRAFKEAALKARHSILIVGWDVHSRMRLEFPDAARPGVPNTLGPFLEHLVTQTEGLEVRVLDWDSPLIYAPDREWLQQARFDWFTHTRLYFAVDDEHPIGASQHQKIVVIDDRVAFVGGCDLTFARLDGPEHLPDDPRRVKPDGSPYDPYHDVQAILEGPAAEAVADVARERWQWATGERPAPVEDPAACWPDDLEPDLAGVDVAIARTYPAWKGRGDVREVEALFLDTIARARHSLYIENQFFTATRAARALLERLGEPDCPEIVLVLPPRPSTWLEQTTMGTRQRYVLARLRQADVHGRFRVYSPMVGEAGETGVKVHAKVMVADDRFVRVGSANLNNRSMGLDSECDVAIEGAPGSAVAGAAIRLRNRLLAEHLDATPERVAEEIETHGSLVAAVEALRGPGRSLAPFPEVPPDTLATVLAESDIFDPEAPAEPERIADELVADTTAQTTLRKAFFRLGMVVVALLALAALWRWGPLAGLADAANIETWAAAVESDWTATALVLGAYVVGGLVMFPVLALIAATGLLYGPLAGLAVAAAGSLMSAVAGYGAGVLLGRRTLRRLSGGALDRVSRQLARRGVLSVTIIRLLPVAPFTVINLAAGASHIRFRDFVAGTALGMAPGIVAITLFSGQLGELMRAPNPVNAALLAALLVVIAGAAYWSWRHFVRRRAVADDA